MGKKDRFKSENGLSGVKSQDQSRLYARKMERKQKKINKAINYANSKNTNKVCISKDDVKFMKTLQNKIITDESTISKDITFALKDKILANNRNSNNSNDLGYSNKRSKKKRKNFKNKENLKNEESSFKMSDNTNARLANLQEFVNRESKKIQNQEKSPKVSNTVKYDGLIKDKQKLDDLLESQQRDQKEVNRYAKRLKLSSYHKKKNHPLFEEDFGSILEDIEDGDFDKYKHEFQKSSNSVDNFENDIMASIGKKKCPTEKEVQKLKSKNSITDQNGMNKNSKNGKVSESDEEIDSDEATEIKLEDKFIDDEAEEVSDDDDNDDDDVLVEENEEDIIFEGGSCLTSNECSILNQPPTINRRGGGGGGDSDLDGFIVDDDYIEYSDENEEPVHKNKKRKKSRIINREFHSERVELDREVDEAERVCNRNFKRSRILSESENEESQSPTKKLLNNSKVLQEESFEVKNEMATCKNSILKKDKCNYNKNSPCDDNNYKSEKRVSFSLSEDTKNSSNTEKIEEYHEDIYGRLRDKDGNIVKTDNNDLKDDGKYVPPAMKKLMALNNSSRKKEQLAQLQKKLKGQLNRLAESNMAGILSQIEAYYYSNSRNDMNDTLTKLLFEMLVTPVMTPERLVQDHALLVSVLSANIGNEVGAHILTEFVLKWIEELENFKPSSNLDEIDSKELDNILMFICQLYNFKVVDSILIYNIIHKILERNLSDKEADLILLDLKECGIHSSQRRSISTKIFNF
ncbi:Nucleolar MIF4G domain-containing protein 1-like protein [Armadillidium vulgare]|nr:Nucleolar MIF4G domain-containing protein 1-like protein [Armadillidium vulgare]